LTQKGFIPQARILVDFSSAIKIEIIRTLSAMDDACSRKQSIGLAHQPRADI
jgi:hypothetical protein